MAIGGAGTEAPVSDSRVDAGSPAPVASGCVLEFPGPWRCFRAGVAIWRRLWGGRGWRRVGWGLRPLTGSARTTPPSCSKQMPPLHRLRFGMQFPLIPKGFHCLKKFEHHFISLCWLFKLVSHHISENWKGPPKTIKFIFQTAIKMSLRGRG